jgi:hypothetical protein
MTEQGSIYFDPEAGEMHYWNGSRWATVDVESPTERTMKEVLERVSI